jgi:catechol 2,3-dioxygenase
MTLTSPLQETAPYVAPKETVIGHVHLKVADAGRAHAFYTETLGFETQAFFDSAAFISAGGYHHHLGLNHWYSHGGAQPAPGAAGLDRVGIEFGSQEALARTARRLVERGATIERVVDLGVAQMVRLADPDGNGLDLLWHRPVEEWPREADGSPAVRPQDLAIETLLALAPDSGAAIDAETRIGYVDLRVVDFERELAFYRDALGFTVVGRKGNSSAMLSADGAHHIIGLRAAEPDAALTKPNDTGLYHLAIRYPTREDLAAAVRRLIAADAGFRMAEDHGVSNAIYFLDPENNGIELYWDRPRDEWPRNDDGSINMGGGLLDLSELVALR